MPQDNTPLVSPTGEVTGGINRADGTYHVLSVDATGQLNVNATFSGSISGNAAAGPTGAAVPSAADYLGVNVAGNLTGVTGFALTNSKAIAIAIVDGSGNQITSFGGGTQYSDGTTQATPTGTVALGKNGTNVLHALSLDGSGNLNVNIAAGASSGTQFADNSVSGATPTGTLSMGWDSVNSKIRALKVDTSQNLNVNVQSIGTVTVTGTVSVGNTPSVDVTDRSARLLGHVTVDNFPGTQPVSGTVTANQGGAPWTVKPDATVWTLTGTSANVNVSNSVTVGGTVAVSGVSGTVAVTQSTNPWTIQGDSASGAAKAGNPVQIGGVFNTTQPTVTTGQTVETQATARGAIIVASGVDAFHATIDNFPGTQPVSGTVTANQGTSPWVTQDNADVTAGTTSAPTKILIVGGKTADGTPAYDPIPLAAGGSSVVISGSVSITGTAAVSGTVTANQGGAPWSQNLTQIAGTALGATAVVNYGSTPAAVAVPAVNAFVTNTVAVSGSVNIGNTPSVDVTDRSGRLLGHVTVDNVSIPVTQSTSPWVENVSQFGGSNVVTGVGNSGAGIPRVTVSSDSIISSITNTVTIAGSVSANQGNPRTVGLGGGWPIVGDSLAETTVGWNSGTAGNSAIQLNCLGYATALITLNQGTLSAGQVTFEASDTAAGTNWYPIMARSLDGATLTTVYNLQSGVNQSFMVNMSGFILIRVRLSTAITGAGTVNIGIIAQAMAATSPQVAVIGGTSGTQYADSAASGVSPTGTLSMGWDSVNGAVRALKVDSSQNLQTTNSSIYAASAQPSSVSGALNMVVDQQGVIRALSGDNFGVLKVDTSRVEDLLTLLVARIEDLKTSLISEFH